MGFKKALQVSIIGHRGYKAKYPENTLLSFEKAIEANADYVELDVYSTSDGVLVVSHDSTTKRCGNLDISIKDHTLEEVKKVDVGQGQTIPTLQEVLTLCRGKCGVQIEIKQESIATKVVDLVVKNQMIEEVLISSFKHSEIANVKRINSKILCASLEPNGLHSAFRSLILSNAKKIKADAIHPLHNLITPDFCRKIHAIGLIVNPWTVDGEENWRKMIDAGVDGIITNDPEGLYQYLKRKSN